MITSRNIGTTLTSLALLGACLFGSGCVHNRSQVVAPDYVPRELKMTPLHEYVVEPPDILLIDAVRVVPKPPYRIEPLDSIFVRATNVIMEEPIAGLYSVQPEGTVDLGLSYGSVRVADMTLEEARDAITKHLKETYPNVQVTVSLGQSRALQQIRGEHLIRPDGTLSLGLYGSVPVVGLTLAQVKDRVEQHLSQYLLNPKVAVDVFAYNSKFYYVVTDGAGFGEQVYRLPNTGNETVLDAVAQVYGLPAVASLKHIWVARPSLDGGHPDQILPVNWKAVTQEGITQTNYQILPGDRIYVKANSLVAVDTFMARLFAPFERGFGLTLLGNSTVQSFRNNQNGFGGGGFGGGF